MANLARVHRGAKSIAKPLLVVAGTIVATSAHAAADAELVTLTSGQADNIGVIKTAALGFLGLSLLLAFGAMALRTTKSRGKSV